MQLKKSPFCAQGLFPLCLILPPWPEGAQPSAQKGLNHPRAAQRLWTLIQPEVFLARMCSLEGRGTPPPHRRRQQCWQKLTLTQAGLWLY